MHDKTLTELSQALTSKIISSYELTSLYLSRIKQFDQQLNSFITITEELALKEAKKADEDRSQNRHGPLTGIPISHKDIFCTDGVKTSCGSKMLDNFIAPLMLP